MIECDDEGSHRRCGGQGDMTAGFACGFLAWASLNKNPLRENLNPTMVAAFGASILTRACAKEAFAKFKRGTTTTDMIHFIPHAFQSFFPS